MFGVPSSSESCRTPDDETFQLLALLGETLGLAFARWEGRVETRCWVSIDLPPVDLPQVTHETHIADARSTLPWVAHPLVKAGVQALSALPSPHGTLWVGSTERRRFDALAPTLRRWCARIDAEVTPAVSDVHKRLIELLLSPAVYVCGDAFFPNAAVEALTGFRRDELPTLEAWFDKLYGEDALVMRGLYEQDRAEPHQRRLLSLRRKDGVERMVEFATRIDGEHEVWLLQDITERLASQERFRVLFEQSSTALAIYDETGFLDCNPAAVALLGYRVRGDVVGQQPWQRSPELQPDGSESRDRLARHETIALTQGSHRFDWTYAKADGSEARVEVTLTPLRLDDRRGLLAEWHDISERLRYQKGLEEARDSALAFAQARSDFLATMSHEIRTPMNGVIGMTRLLAETPLDARQREYLDTVRACGEGLLALINDILDFSRLEAGKVSLERIPFSVREVAEDAAQVVAPQAHGKGLELCCDVAADVPTLVWGDPTRLRQVLLNLLSNAVKFTPQGSVVLEVRAEATGVRFLVRDSGIGIAPDVLPRLFSAFSQADRSTTRRFGGSGLGLAICKRLTELMNGGVTVESSARGSVFTVTLPLEAHTVELRAPAFQGEAVLLLEPRPTTRALLVSQLRGMGLRVVTDVTWADVVLVDQQCDDDLSLAVVNDARAKGKPVGVLRHFDGSGGVKVPADFVVSSPVRERGLERELRGVLRPDPKATREARPMGTTRFSARVLVAEDNAVNQRVVRALLEKLGCTVTVAGNGRLAVERCSEADFDLVFMDCQMPELDGFEATRHIRKADPRVPVLALTAGVMEGDRERCLEAGMNDFLSKPIRPEELERALRRWLPHAERASA